MRLLRSTTLEFENFEGGNIPPYAILSHTWESEEVSFQEMLHGQGVLKAGYEKIKCCGEIAAENVPTLEFFWVDTCCIDKSSSSELSEAINSMFTWYKNASVCYAYLSDVSATSPPHPVYETVSTFKSSKWFSRGWTLQELIAPSDLIFFSKEWIPVGTKEALKDHIQEITGISRRALEGADLGVFSISERMSWASKRKTTRIEDMAYSLMGIFDINMPLIYGEREKSFLRLQEEIMKVSDDQSLFAWADESTSSGLYSGLLACSPKHFAKSGNIFSLGIWGKSQAFSVTNKGLRVELFLMPAIESRGVYRASLDCFYKNSMEESPGIYLMRLAGSETTWTTTSNTQFARLDPSRLEILRTRDKTSGEYRTVNVKQNSIFQQGPPELNALKLFRIVNERGRPDDVYPLERWNPQSDLLTSPVVVGKVAGLLFRQDEMRYMIILGLTEQGTPWVHIICEASVDAHGDWKSYCASGNEGCDLSMAYTIGETPYFIEVAVTAIKVYASSIFVVRIYADRHKPRQDSV